LLHLSIIIIIIIIINTIILFMRLSWHSDNVTLQ